ncbi:hypothetical protein BS50DRAFT_509430, partial [Corynespora cassiicola Philippines]
NRGWASVVLRINVTRWVVPPFFTFQAKHQNQCWYEDMPEAWCVGISENRQTSLHDLY